MLASASLRDLFLLAKPRVVSLVVFTAAIGAALAAFRHPAAPGPVLLALAGIALASGSAAAFNCLAESRRDAVMDRTRGRPLPAGRVRARDAACFAALLGASGLWLVARFGGLAAAALTAATVFGYAVVYTMYLKRATPQNIVIGGASGAMPPVLGWVSVSGEPTFEPLLLFLVIFVWTPPHFWALAMYRADDYARAGLPMLPVTHGRSFTASHILFYSVILLAASLLPFASGMAGPLYAAAAALLGARFVWLARRLRATLAESDSRRLFKYSISYLFLLFAALLADSLAGAFA